MFSFYIARRYLFTKKSHHAINIISGIAVVGVAVATAALVCIMSVFNGFQDMVADLFNAFDPELKVVAVEGKFMSADAKELQELKKNPDIAVFSEVIEDNALLVANNHQVMATVKGVDDNFEKLVDFDRIKYGAGVYELHADVLEYGIFGINLLSTLGISTDFSTPVQVYAPRGGSHIDLNDPTESFNQDELYSPRVCFNVRQQKYDSHYVLTSKQFAQKIFEREGQLSSIEIKVKDGLNINTVKKKIAKSLGSDYKVLDRYEQQEDTFKIMQIEKLMSYIFLVLILVIACFNIIGSLSMLIIEKKEDAITLRNLGATEKQIASVFMIEGRLIAFVGAVLGLIIGVVLCYIQQKYGVIKFGHSAGSYIIDSYPVNIHIMDIVIIFFTVIIVGFLSVWYPVRHLSKKFTRAALSVAVLLVMVSCGPGGSKFQIKGEFKDMPAGMLYVYNLGDETACFDTIYINNGEFKYIGHVEELTPYYIVFPNALEQVFFAAPGDNLTYKASANDLKNYSVGGSDENQLMNRFRKDIDGLSDIQAQDMAARYIKENTDSYVAVYLFERYFAKNENARLNDIKEQLNILKPKWQDNMLLKETEYKLKQMSSTGIGKKLPDVKLETKQKEQIRLSKINSDYTLLLFWASWIDYQYEFIEGFRDLSKKYGENKSSLKIITVSLDNQIFRWQDFIGNDTLYSSHVCDGLAWETPLVRQLGIMSLPTYILADKNHKIVAKGTTIKELRSDLKNYIGDITE